MEEKKKTEIKDIDEEGEQKEAQAKPPTKDESIKDQAITNFLQNTVNIMVPDFRVYPAISGNGKVAVLLDSLGRPLLNVSLSFDTDTAKAFAHELI